MEDLGNININIREFGSSGGGGGGGGGGSGQPGGGARVPAPPKAAAQAQASDSASLLSLLKSASNIKGEISGFVSNPSIGGFADLLSTSSATGEALASLGAIAGAATAAFSVVIVAVAAAVYAMKLLRSAAESTAERIRAVGRYSGEIISAQIVERIRVMQRSMREAAENGHLYAMAQREATRAADATDNVMRDLNKVLAYAAIIWHKLVAGFMQMIEPMSKFAGMVANIAAQQSVSDGLMVALAGLAVPLLDGFGYTNPLFSTISFQLRMALAHLAAIQNNTAKTSTLNPNSWALADLEAITGRKYTAATRTVSVSSPSGYATAASAGRGSAGSSGASSGGTSGYPRGTIVGQTPQEQAKNSTTRSGTAAGTRTPHKPYVNSQWRSFM